MIDFEEELKKFKPSLEVEEVEDAIYDRDLTDMTDIMQEILKEAFLECPPPIWQVPQCGACRYRLGERQMRSIFGMPFADMAGAALRRVPLQTRRKE